MAKQSGFDLVTKEAETLQEIKITREILESPDFQKTYSQLLSLKALIESIDEKIRTDAKDIVKNNYLETNEQSMIFGDYMFTYRSGSNRENFDKKKFKEDFGDDVYNKYIKVSKTKEGISISKVQEKADDPLIVEVETKEAK